MFVDSFKVLCRRFPGDNLDSKDGDNFIQESTYLDRGLKWMPPEYKARRTSQNFIFILSFRPNDRFKFPRGGSGFFVASDFRIQSVWGPLGMGGEYFLGCTWRGTWNWLHICCWDSEFVVFFRPDRCYFMAFWLQVCLAFVFRFA
jgi:hypothetical protein